MSQISRATRASAWCVRSGTNPSVRISGASVSPWTTSVSTITHIVTTTISRRNGNGAPLASVSGSASAVASDTIPRMLVHATSATPFADGACSVRRM